MCSVVSRVHGTAAALLACGVMVLSHPPLCRPPWCLLCHRNERGLVAVATRRRGGAAMACTASAQPPRCLNWRWTGRQVRRPTHHGSRTAWPGVGVDCLAVAVGAVAVAQSDVCEDHVCDSACPPPARTWKYVHSVCACGAPSTCETVHGGVWRDCCACLLEQAVFQQLVDEGVCGVRLLWELLDVAPDRVSAQHVLLLHTRGWLDVRLALRCIAGRCSNDVNASVFVPSLLRCGSSVAGWARCVSAALLAHAARAPDAVPDTVYATAGVTADAGAITRWCRAALLSCLSPGVCCARDAVAVCKLIAVAVSAADDDDAADANSHDDHGGADSTRVDPPALQWWRSDSSLRTRVLTALLLLSPRHRGDGDSAVTVDGPTLTDVATLLFATHAADGAPLATVDELVSCLRPALCVVAAPGVRSTVFTPFLVAVAAVAPARPPLLEVVLACVEAAVAASLFDDRCCCGGRCAVTRPALCLCQCLLSTARDADAAASVFCAPDPPSVDGRRSDSAPPFARCKGCAVGGVCWRVVCATRRCLPSVAAPEYAAWFRAVFGDPNELLNKTDRAGRMWTAAIATATAPTAPAVSAALTSLVAVLTADVPFAAGHVLRSWQVGGPVHATVNA